MEIGRAGKQTDSSVHTIFFGGGTPSLLSGPQFESILRALTSAFTVAPEAEITIEANPGTIAPQKLETIRKAGVNRISFGVQSANHEELRMLEREHDFPTVIRAVSTARQAGFDNLNLDLIYSLPEQTLQSWKSTLQRAAELHPEHISAYALTLEHGTPFGKWAQKGLLPIPDPDLAAEMYEYTEEFLEENGYIHYEISNWARPGFECRHNLQYWRSLPYLAFGAGAHGYAEGYRFSNVLRIKTYIERLARDIEAEFPFTPATINKHKQSRADDISDYMINNLRLVNVGVEEADFRSRFGGGLLDEYPHDIGDLIQKGLLEKKASDNSEAYRLTRRGRLLGNQVFMRFVQSLGN